MLPFLSRQTVLSVRHFPSLPMLQIPFILYSLISFCSQKKEKKKHLTDLSAGFSVSVLMKTLAVRIYLLCFPVIFFFRCNTSLYHIEYIATFSYPGFFFIFYLSSCILPLFLSLLFNVFFFNSSFIHLKLFCTIITSCLLNVIIIKIRSYQICLPITSRIFMFILFITLLTG